MFVGRTPGAIVPARGPPDFGWDPVFEAEGTGRTYAEMDKGLKNSISHRWGVGLHRHVESFTDTVQIQRVRGARYAGAYGLIVLSSCLGLPLLTGMVCSCAAGAYGTGGWAAGLHGCRSEKRVVMGVICSCERG